MAPFMKKGNTEYIKWITHAMSYKVVHFFFPENTIFTPQFGDIFTGEDKGTEFCKTLLGWMFVWGPYLVERSSYNQDVTSWQRQPGSGLIYPGSGTFSSYFSSSGTTSQNRRMFYSGYTLQLSCCTDLFHFVLKDNIKNKPLEHTQVLKLSQINRWYQHIKHAIDMDLQVK